MEQPLSLMIQIWQPDDEQEDGHNRYYYGLSQPSIGYWPLSSNCNVANLHS
jgi:hypothetical protein